MQLRDYQGKAVNDIRQAYLDGYQSPLFVLPTGGGKTVFFTYVANEAARKGNNVLILVHRVELLRQTAKTLNSFGVRCGLVSPKFRPDYTAKIQVGSVQTVINRLDKIPKPDIIIVDEAHHATASTWAKVIKNYTDYSGLISDIKPRPAKVLGVTATPIRGDGKGLGINSGGLFDIMIEGPQMQELIDMGFLVKPRIIEAELFIDRSKLKTKMSDFDKKQSASLMDKPKILGDTVNYYRKFAHKRPAVAFCINVAHAHHVAEEFKANGYNAAAVDGAMDDSDRKNILEGLGNGNIDVVTSCDLIGEGVDIPVISAAILLRPTKSKGLYLQQVGRVLRTADNKKDAIILDHVGNVTQHLLPQMHQEWSLEGIPKKKGKSKEKEPVISLIHCESCYTVQPRQPNCEVCGNKLITPKEIKHDSAAKMRELTDEEIAKRLAKKQKRQEEGRAQTLEELQELASQRGYKPGWAEYRFNSRKNRR